MVEVNEIRKALSAIVADPPPLADLSQQLCQVSQPALPVQAVGMSLGNSEQTDGDVYLGASDPRADRTERAQLSLRQGPGISALRDARPVLVPDLQTQTARRRWPLFTRAAAATLDIAAQFSFPMQLGTTQLGVLSCYRTRSGPLEYPGQVLAIVDLLTLVLLEIRGRTHAVDTRFDVFDTSWRGFPPVYQAVGVLAAHLGVPTGDALARLRLHAARQLRPLSEVAADVVAVSLHLPRTRDMPADQGELITGPQGP